jgi:hypothetical protein
VEGAGGGVPSLGTLEDTFRRLPDSGNSLYGGPSVVWGTQLGGGAHMPVALMNEGRRSLVVEYLFVRFSTKAT